MTNKEYGASLLLEIENLKKEQTKYRLESRDCRSIAKAYAKDIDCLKEAIEREVQAQTKKDPEALRARWKEVYDKKALYRARIEQDKYLARKIKRLEENIRVKEILLLNIAKGEENYGRNK